MTTKKLTPDDAPATVKNLYPKNDPVDIGIDDEGYVTEAALDRIREWPYTDIAGCFDFIQQCWWGPEYGFRRELVGEEAIVVHAERGEKFVRLATAGWSGNEAIIRALRENRMLHIFTWCLSAKGGLHIYRIPTEAQS